MKFRSPNNNVEGMESNNSNDNNKNKNNNSKKL